MQGAAKWKRVWPGAMAAAGMLAVLLLAPPVEAADLYWVGDTGNWQDAANWSLTPGGPGGAGAPQEGDNAYLTPSNFKKQTVTYSSSSTTILKDLYIDAPSKDSITLQQDQGYLKCFSPGVGVLNGTEYIGYSGSGTFTQKGGSNSAIKIILGYNPGSQGTYNMVDGSLSIGFSLGWPSLFVGYSGSGTVNQSGGSVNTVGMTLGHNPGSSGTYNLSGGKIYGELIGVGDSGKGTVNLTSGEMRATYMILGSNGTLNMKGGRFVGSQDFKIGGTIKQSGGDAGGVRFFLGGTYNLTGGSLGSYLSFISGTFTQKGGTFATANLSLSGTYTLHEGILSGPPSGPTIEVKSGGVFKAGEGVNVQVSTLAVGPAEVASTGYLTGKENSVWTVAGDFISHSIANKAWDTSRSDLVFLPGLEHQFSVCGVDFGRTLAGYTDNFTWDTLDLTGSTMVHLQDGNADLGGALYVRSILGATLLGGLVTDIEGNDLNIYYDPDLKENAYLNRQTFDLIDGGHLSPYHTPLPPTVWLLGSGLLGLIGWRLKRSKCY